MRFVLGFLLKTMFIILDAVVVHATKDVKYKGSKYQKLYPSNKTFYNPNVGKCVTFSMKDLKDVKEIEMKSPFHQYIPS